MIRINLLPKVSRKVLPGRTILEIGFPAAVLGVAIVLWAILAGQNAALQRDIDAANKEINELRPTVERVIELDRQIGVMRERERVVADLLKQQLPAAAILNEIRLLIPKEVWVLSMNVPDPSVINMEGMAMNYYAVARLMDNLASGQLFRDVDLTVVQLEKIGSSEVVRYQITARISKPQAMGGDRP
ncbi:MAG TPA: PilN domain-containing protein [bacterium]|nr:PilN domain-containing protein [bacterium]